ncbi:hypothetical protein PF005_g8221 [Phytophthora fragariae]|uniref:Uncharacterized protein n=1 Tax=Phytophthora fragariae TaxID=53985 RepID=A0A6A3UNS6_9STRA|nr:hypothetical protein PF003_g458 [Phytophthora fragariae]KAE9120312.1 hypothetical protein PF007_g8215 [Phytophthora fragariae]KAE9152929.1 hypothetical protein PF006_g2899 [Phytophthora fragariae]KAE9218563.1 hypothetical protein PF005_g8221 [Phytophthora fragariae]KAE9255443.1 hypothetical protein PF002_g2341 [Phytophthora fragariae]
MNLYDNGCQVQSKLADLTILSDGGVAASAGSND